MPRFHVDGPRVVAALRVVTADVGRSGGARSCPVIKVRAIVPQQKERVEVVRVANELAECRRLVYR
jgi:hypothetical protein